MIKVLLLGHKGFLGREFRFYLRNKKIIYSHFKKKKIKFSLLKKKILQFKPNFIINCIAKTNIVYCDKNPKQAFESNVKIPAIILKIIKNTSIKFIHFSSEAVFKGKDLKKTYSEKDVPKPQTIYGITKYEADKLVIQSKNTLIIRLPFLFSRSYNRNICAILLNKLSKNQSVHISMNFFSTFVYAPDLCSFVYNKCIRTDAYFKNKLIHFTTNKKMSMYNFVKKLAKNYRKINIKKIIPVNESYFRKGVKNIPMYLGLSSIYSGTSKSLNYKKL